MPRRRRRGCVACGRSVSATSHQAREWTGTSCWPHLGVVIVARGATSGKRVGCCVRTGKAYGLDAVQSCVSGIGDEDGREEIMVRPVAPEVVGAKQCLAEGHGYRRTPRWSPTCRVPRLLRCPPRSVGTILRLRVRRPSVKIESTVSNISGWQPSR